MNIVITNPNGKRHEVTYGHLVTFPPAVCPECSPATCGDGEPLVRHFTLPDVARLGDRFTCPHCQRFWILSEQGDAPHGQMARAEATRRRLWLFVYALATLIGGWFLWAGYTIVVRALR